MSKYNHSAAYSQGQVDLKLGQIQGRCPLGAGRLWTPLKATPKLSAPPARPTVLHSFAQLCMPEYCF